MKKIIMTVFLLTICIPTYSAPISVSEFNDANDVTVSHLETQRSTFQDAINSADGALIQGGTIPAEALTDNASPVVRDDERFNDFVYTGLLPVDNGTDLIEEIPLGTAYIYGERVVKTATSKTFTASKDTYIDLSSNGTFTYTEVSQGNSAPAVASNSLRLCRVSTDTTQVRGVEDLRVMNITLTTTNKIADADGNTKVDTEKNANENIIRFDIAGVEQINLQDGSLQPTTDADINLGSNTKRFNIANINRISADTVTAVSQPFFSVEANGLETDFPLGVDTIISWDTETIDTGNNFANHTFTAPISGKYLMAANVIFTAPFGSGTPIFQLKIITSNRTYLTSLESNVFGGANTGTFTLPISYIVDMDAGDTAQIKIRQTGGSEMSLISDNSRWTGILLY